MGLVYQYDDADIYLIVDDVIYSFSDGNVLLDVHSDVVHDDQLDVDDVLILILDGIIMPVVVVDILVLCDVVADHDALCISLLDGLLSRYVVGIYADNVVAMAMSNFAVVDAGAAFVVASLVGVASLLWMPPLELYSSLSDVDLPLLRADDVLFLFDVVVAVCCHCSSLLPLLLLLFSSCCCRGRR